MRPDLRIVYAEDLVMAPDPNAPPQDVRDIPDHLGRRFCRWCPEKAHFGSPYCSARCEERHGKSRHLGTICGRDLHPEGAFLGLGVMGPTLNPYGGSLGAPYVSEVWRYPNEARDVLRRMKINRIVVSVSVMVLVLLAGVWIGGAW